jgi:hypothetical protein
MNHLLNVLDGFASVWGLHSQAGRAYVLERRGGFQLDQARLRGDAERVGDDIKKSVRTYGEQSSSRTGYQQKR